MILFPKKSTNVLTAKRILQDHLRSYPILHREDDGRIYVDENVFVFTKKRNGLTTLVPNITSQGILFRGDSSKKDNHTKLSSFGTFCSEHKNDEDFGFQLMLDKIRYLDFAHAIYSFPLNKMFSDGIDMPDGHKAIMLNPYGLSHAYGYRSSFVSLTKDLDIAIFYAVTRYNHETKQYDIAEPETQGVLYSYEMRNRFSMIKGLTALGLHVFPRPGLNKEFVFEIVDENDFNRYQSVKGYVFTQDEQISREYLEKYDYGRALMPEDDLLYRHISFFPEKKVSAISLGIFMIGVDEHVNRNFREYLDRNEIEVSDTFRPFFVREELNGFYEHIDEFWKGFCDKIVFPGDEKMKGITNREFFEHLPEHAVYGKFFSKEYLKD